MNNYTYPQRDYSFSENQLLNILDICLKHNKSITNYNFYGNHDDIESDYNMIQNNQFSTQRPNHTNLNQNNNNNYQNPSNIGSFVDNLLSGIQNTGINIGRTDVIYPNNNRNSISTSNQTSTSLSGVTNESGNDTSVNSEQNISPENLNRNISTNNLSDYINRNNTPIPANFEILISEINENSDSDIPSSENPS